MKIQYLAVIFIVIILPISLVLSQYARVQIDTINMQTKYNKLLSEATYDTIKAFQLNTVNNRYSNVATSKLRDITAASNTFFKTLGTTMVYNREDLEQHIPAIIYTLYDGYYVYTKSYTSDIKSEFSIKPFVYYTRYYQDQAGTGRKAIINYTLDNYMTVFYFNPNATNDEDKYITISGFYTNPDDIELIEGVEYENMNYGANGTLKIKYQGIEITEELLTENLVFSSLENPYEYNYIKYGNKKIYRNNALSDVKYFWYENYVKTPIYDNAIKNYAENRRGNGGIYSRSAVDYYYNAKKFSEWVNSNLDWIRDDNKKIFNIPNEIPELRGSTFNEHRMEVIRESITTNLIKAIANYNSYANSYEYELPQISEIDWDDLLNNVSVITFLQGIPIGSKYFNDYCVITNNKTEEMISKNSIYMVGGQEYHKIGCPNLVKNKIAQIKGYFNLDFVRQTVKSNLGQENDNQENVYFYPRTESGCYYCTVKSELSYTPDDIISGNDIIIGGTTFKKENYANLRKYYLTALAREKQDLYKSNSFKDNI